MVSDAIRAKLIEFVILAEPWEDDEPYNNHIVRERRPRDKDGQLSAVDGLIVHYRSVRGIH